MNVLLTGRVKKVGCLDSSSYLPSVEPPASTDFEVVFLPIPIVSRMSGTCIQYTRECFWVDQPSTNRTIPYLNSSSSGNRKVPQQSSWKGCFLQVLLAPRIKTTFIFFLDYPSYMHKHICPSDLLPLSQPQLMST